MSTFDDFMERHKKFEDIPGTYLFNSDRSRKGYHLNMFCMSLLKPENREAFLADEEAYLDDYPMTPKQRQAVLDRDWLGMIKEGGNIYFMAKLGATDGKSVQFVAGEMTGMGEDAYRDMMVGGGRGIDGNRSKAEVEGA